MGLHQLQQLGVDRGPDRPAGRLGAAEQRVEVGGRGGVWLDHRFDRDLDPQVELLAYTGVDDPAGAPRPDHEPADLLERLLRGRQPDSLDLVAGGLGETLERQRQVGAALGRRDRVDLVDDAPASAGEQLLGAPGQHQVQRLRGGDQDVWRLAEHRLALALWSVPGADRNLQVGADPPQRRAQVAIDVVRQRLQWRHVDESDPAVLSGAILAGQAVDRVQERGQRLTRAGGR